MNIFGALAWQYITTNGKMILRNYSPSFYYQFISTLGYKEVQIKHFLLEKV